MRISKSLTHGGDHVSCGTLVVREPESSQLGGGENDEGLSDGTKGLTYHHCRVWDCILRLLKFPKEAHQTSEHVQPGSQNQLQSQHGKRSTHAVSDLRSNLHSIPPLVLTAYVSALLRVRF